MISKAVVKLGVATCWSNTMISKGCGITLCRLGR
jgi:hypothetical protein